MSPLVTIFAIMLLTVVHNESQFIADYQDEYEKLMTKNAMPFELCDLASKKTKCKKLNTWREFLKNTDDAREDVHDFVYDSIEDENIKIQIAKPTDQKRNYPHRIVNSNVYNCETVKSRVDLGEGYYPRLIGNITCDYNSNESLQICSRGWSCQPVKYMARVLSKRSLEDDVPNDLPKELRGCWLFEEIPIHVGCKCGR